MSEPVTLLDGRVQLYLGDCREILPTLGKVDAVVTTPDAATEALAEIAERARRRAEKDRALTIRWLVVVLVCLAALCWFAWFTQ